MNLKYFIVFVAGMAALAGCQEASEYIPSIYITEAQRVEAVACGIRLDPRKAPDADKPRVTGWFADTVAADVIRDLQERLGYSSAQASALFYAGGLTVYTTVDEELQALVDAYYRDTLHFPTGKRGQPAVGAGSA